MGEMQKQTLLRKTGDSVSSAANAVERGLPLAFARAAEETLELSLQVTSVTTQELLLDALRTHLDAEGLFLILEGPNGATGAVVLAKDTLCALLEHLTMGRVLGKPPIEGRAPTAVDAALVSPVLDDLLAECDKAFADLPSEDWPRQHRFGSMVEDRRTLVLSLATKGFSLFDVSLSFSEGTAEGRLQILLPNDRALALDEHGEDQQLLRAELFRENVMLAPAEMRAVLTKITMPFDKLQALTPGDLIEVPATALQHTILEFQQGEEMARAVLGQINGQRAVRIVLPSDHQPAEFEGGEADVAQLPQQSAPVPEPSVIDAKAEPAVEQKPPNALDGFDLDLDDLDKLAQA